MTAKRPAKTTASAVTTIPAAPTCDQALINAARILNFCETETNLPLVERMEHLADSWISIAGLQHERERT